MPHAAACYHAAKSVPRSADIEIRQVRTDEEWLAHSFISSYSFNAERTPERAERRARYIERDWCIAAFDRNEMVAGLFTYPLEQYINGARIPLGGIAAVSCLPEHRRGGYVGALLKRALVDMRDRGQPLSLLHTPHFSLYRRFGWEIANRGITYTFAPKAVRLRRGGPRGRFRRVGPEDWRQLDAVYTRFASVRNGPLVRDERWWRTRVLNEHAPERPHDAAIWTNDAGEDRGYIVYRSKTSDAAPPWGDEITFYAVDLVALDAAAYAALLGFVLKHDLSAKVFIMTGVDEPFLDAFEEPLHVDQSAWHACMLRIVDVQRALEVRPALEQASGKSVTIAVTDAAAPWNTGAWRIDAREGRISCDATDATPQLSMDVCALAALYNGYMHAAEAVRVGAVEVHDAAAIGAAATIFATSLAPCCMDEF